MTCGKGQRQRQRDCICKDGQSPEDCGGCGDEPLEDWQPCMDEECAPSKFFCTIECALSANLIYCMFACVIAIGFTFCVAQIFARM